jgi:DNA-binding PadR family transcriptional regulator
MSPRQTAPLTLEHVLLALLDSRPMHGYELYHELSQASGISLIWNITQSMLYVMLDKLEEHQFLSSTLVQSDAYPPRKVFQVTEAGRQSLAQWMSTPVRRARLLRQEFLAKLIVARRYGAAQALGLVRAQRQACQEWLDQLRADLPSKDAGRMDSWLVFSYRIHRLEAIMEWLDLCERELALEHAPA